MFLIETACVHFYFFAFYRLQKNAFSYLVLFLFAILPKERLSRAIVVIWDCLGSNFSYPLILFPIRYAGETVTIVGDHDPTLLKYFDCTRSGPRSAFDSNVVYQFEIMEYVSLLWFFTFIKFLPFSWYFCSLGYNIFYGHIDFNR